MHPSQGHRGLWGPSVSHSLPHTTACQSSAACNHHMQSSQQQQHHLPAFARNVHLRTKHQPPNNNHASTGRVQHVLCVRVLTLSLSPLNSPAPAPAQPPPQRWPHQTPPNLKNASIPPSTVGGCQQVMLSSREGHRVLPPPPLMNHAAGTGRTPKQNGQQEPRPTCVARRQAEHNKTPRYVCPVVWQGPVPPTML